MTDGDFITSRHSGKVTHSRLNKMIISRQASFKTQSHHFRAVVLYNVSKRYQTWAQRSYERPVEIPKGVCARVSQGWERHSQYICAQH